VIGIVSPVHLAATSVIVLAELRTGDPRDEVGKMFGLE
jgi:hypothetical protein